jgi:carbamoyltransferase
MLQAPRVVPGKETVVPAITHVDNTARVQTVNRDANPRYWKLIKAFEENTGIPLVLNTSFNLRGEPIVCSPEEAISTFERTEMDLLVLGDFVVAKSAGPDQV